MAYGAFTIHYFGNSKSWYVEKTISVSCILCYVLWLMGKAQQSGAERDQFWLAGVGEGRRSTAQCPWLLWEAVLGKKVGPRCSAVLCA